MVTIFNIFFDMLAKILTAVVTPLSRVIGAVGPIFNSAMDQLVPGLILAGMIVSDLRGFAKWRKREGLQGGIEYAFFTVLVQGFLIISLWFIPQRIEWATNSAITAASIRWVLLFASSLGVYFWTRKHGRYRGLLTYLAHIGLLRLGWEFGEWMGIFLISIPLLFALYLTLYYLAMAIVPAADPDSPFLSLVEVKAVLAQLLSRLMGSSQAEHDLSDQQSIGRRFRELISAMPRMPGEKWKRFQILFWYLWGLQYPLLVVTDTIGRNIETRISGSPFKKWGAPGMIWCHSNQVVGLTDGPNFARVGGPGPVFTKHFERVLQLMDLSQPASEAELVGCVDLRTQLRTAVIEAVSKDGHSFQAVLFIAFRIDAQKEWSRAEYHRLRKANPILEGGRICDRGTEAYPYNEARVQATLGTTAIDDSVPSAVKAIHWDQWILNQMCDAAQQILSQRNLDELWRPRGNGPGKNALDEIGNELKDLMAPRMQEFGIQLAAARVVHYLIPEDRPVVKQQIATWSAAWEKRANETLADGQAEAERLELEAKAYARYMFLTMVAEGLEQARLINPDLPKHIVAMRVIAAMEELLKQRPGATSEESAGHVAAIRQRMLPH